MTQERALYQSVAPLRNVSALVALIDRIEKRAHGLPGMAVFYGPSGDGKTTAAVYAANKADAILIEVRSVWREGFFLDAILRELGQKPGPTNAVKLNQVSEALAYSGRPLLIDEADHLVARKTVQIVRDIHDSSGATVILIGEEGLPDQLKRWERVHGRMLDWVATQPASMADLDALARIYAPGIDLAPDLKEALLKSTHGSVRRISVNLATAQEYALTRGLQSLDAQTFPASRFFTGTPPVPRSAPALRAVK